MRYLFESGLRICGIVTVTESMTTARKTLLALVAYFKTDLTGMAASSPSRNPGSRYSSLYEREETSDLVILVGIEPRRQRIPVHSWVLCDGSEYFQRLLGGSFKVPADNVLHFPEDSPKGFNSFVRWLYEGECHLRSVEGALLTAEVAIKYLCPELVEHAIKFIVKNMQSSDTLIIISMIYKHRRMDVPDGDLPSAPEIALIEEGDNSSPLDPTEHCILLIKKCFEAVDMHTEDVLNSDYIEEVSLPVLHLILKRQSLSMASEVFPLKILWRWSSMECKRTCLPMTLENRREVLQDTLYLIRIMTLSPAELKDSLVQMYIRDLYTKEEIEYITTHVMKECNPIVPPYTLASHLETLCSPRRDPILEGKGTLDNLSKCPKSRTRFKKRKGKEIIYDIVAMLAYIFD